MSQSAFAPVGLSIYYTGAKESISRMMFRVDGGLGAGSDPPESASLHGFPSRSKLSAMFTELYRCKDASSLTGENDIRYHIQTDRGLPLQAEAGE